MQVKCQSREKQGGTQQIAKDWAQEQSNLWPLQRESFCSWYVLERLGALRGLDRLGAKLARFTELVRHA